MSKYNHILSFEGDLDHGDLRKLQDARDILKKAHDDLKAAGFAPVSETKPARKARAAKAAKAK